MTTTAPDPQSTGQPEPRNGSAAALLLVTAKSLQGYVLGSDKLREMVGATQLIEDFCGRETAEDVLAAMGIGDGDVLTGAAGQITVRFDSENSARRAAALWPWFASRLAPGLEVHVGVAPLSLGYKGALDECQKQIAVSRNRPPATLPAAAPPHRRNPRSGKIAVGEDHEPDEIVPVDAEGRAKRDRRKLITGNKAGNDSIFSTFRLVPESESSENSERPESDDKDFIPDTFEEITAGGDKENRTYLGIVHADGNGFGKMLMTIGKAVSDWDLNASVTLFTKLSLAIKEIGKNAVDKAIGAIEKRVEPIKVRRNHETAWIKPWLPIVQAGDDLTLVIRADLAFDFLVEYLEAFEKISGEKINAIRQENPNLPLPENLTAGGAIVYCKTQHPFSQAYALCESLASKRAKGNVVREDRDPDKSARSALAFHRITASTCPTDIDDLSAGELRCTDRQTRTLELGCQTWFVNAGDEPFSVTKLKALRDALAKYPSGSRRQILSDLRTNPAEAGARLARMIKIAAEGGRGEEKRKDLEEALKALHDGAGKLWRQAEGENQPARSAIPDALVLLEAVRSSSSD